MIKIPIKESVLLEKIRNRIGDNGMVFLVLEKGVGEGSLQSLPSKDPVEDFLFRNKISYKLSKDGSSFDENKYKLSKSNNGNNYSLNMTQVKIVYGE